MIVATLLALLSPAPETAPVKHPIVIAHRGASGLRPEHTLESYTLAIEQGADFIEPDLVPTKDNVLVARHENAIGGTTNVADHPEFAGRKTTKSIDGQAITDWFVEDFTLAELKTLRAKERLPQLRPDNTRYDGQFAIPTFDEVIALAKAETAKRGRTIGVYPETKHPTYFASIGHPTDGLVLAALRKAGWDRADAPVFIQSFEVANLKHLHGLTKVPLIQLVDAQGGPADGGAPSYAAMISPAGLREVASYAAGLGPNLELLVNGTQPSSLVADAHAAGLKVHPWTFRAENYFLPAPFKTGPDPRAHGGIAEAMGAALAIGVDGFFTDFPLDGVRARDAFVAARR
jgi:glycerophosphoryl diester phosphodiesterase